MKQHDFKSVYRYARTVDIVNDDYFNVAGYFWLNLTLRQVNYMYTAMVSQGNTEKVDERGRYIELRNGCRIYNPNVKPR